MKFIIERKKLLDAVLVASKAAAAIPTVSEIPCIHLETNSAKRRLKLTSTNMEFSIQNIIDDVRIAEDGEVLLPSKLFGTLLAMPNEEILEFSVDNRNQIYLDIGSTHYVLYTMAADKFPKMEVPFPSSTIKIQGASNMFRRSLIAAEKSNNNAISQAVKLIFSREKSLATATDQYRISIAEQEGCADGQLEMTLHRSALETLCSITTGQNNEWFVGLNNKWAVFFKKDIIFSARLLEQNATNLDPGKFRGFFKEKYRCITDVAVFNSALDIVGVCAGNDPLNLTISKKGILMSAKSDRGNSKSVANATQITETPSEGFYYNYRYITDFLKLARGELIVKMDDRGIMLLEASGTQYFVLPRKKAATTAKKRTAKTKKEAAAKVA